MRNLLVLAMACASSVLGCGNDRGAAIPDAAPVPDERARLCPTAQSMDAIPQRLDAVAPTATWTFTELSAAVGSACGGCHVTPQANGGFTYTAAYTGPSSAPGVAAVAAKMATQLVAQKMPPDNIRSGDPAYYLKLGSRLQAWIAAGSPETGTFPLPNETIGSGQQLPAPIAAAMTDLGDCVPLPEVVHQDPAVDAMFASATQLPMHLADTDLVSLDAYVLAQRGTVAFDVEYPLWADNAHKGRWVHVPSVMDAQGNAQRQPITLDPVTGQFQIPDNTRFYKTFFKQVKESDGVVRYRKVETRLIVVRHAPAKPLFGTYVWDAGEQSATLHTLPYRDGTPFKDLVLSLETDVTTGAHRTYAIPGASRCNDCHQGSASDSFILGFTPLQINRRAMGEAGRDAPSGPDEMSQLSRLVSYGVIAGVAPDTAPRLETSNTTKQPRNVHELRFQAYAAGNCAHCHNPKGFAVKQGIGFNFAPGGDIFQFILNFPGSHSPGLIVKPGLVAESLLYERVSMPSHVDSHSNAQLHMPLHTPGIDCEAVNRAGKWITSIPNVVSNTTPSPSDIAKALDNADKFVSSCQTADDVTWIEEDFSDPPVYAPRRGDWNDKDLGIPQALRDLEFTDRLQVLAESRIPMGYLPDGKPACHFPDAPPPPDGPSPWMLDADGNPKKPYSQLRYEQPGEYFFSNVCSKCHGPHANADTYLAKTILSLSGGDVRVANLHDGLVGMRGANLSAFDVVADNGVRRNLAGNYLIWMASGGTKVKFPEGLVEIIGPNGGNMLFLVRQLCQNLLPGGSQTANPTWQNYDVLFKSCAFDNPITPELGFGADGRTPLNPALQNAWLDRAAKNVGWAIFSYLKTKVAIDEWPQLDCHVLFP